jgi:hypothetical protein
MKLKNLFCQFPNPWALRVSGMGGYTSKCEKSQNHCTLMSKLLAVDRDTPCTSIWLVVKRDAPFLYDIEKSYVDAGMPDKS